MMKAEMTQEERLEIYRELLAHFMEQGYSYDEAREIIFNCKEED